LYGTTKVAAGTKVACEDWVTIDDDFVNFEFEHDPRPVVLCGLSATVGPIQKQQIKIKITTILVDINRIN
jgi:hypothetical protein